MELIDKDRIVAEINKRIIDAPINNIGHQRVWAYNDVKDIIDTLEVKEADLEKEKVENIKKQCPFREVVCNKYQNHPLKCSGACAFVSDRITLEKKRLYDIQNIPVDEEKLRNDRRNTV